MGRMKQHPRYNVLSFRASDAELKEIADSLSGVSRQSFLLEAALEKVRNDRQSYIDMMIIKRNVQ